MPSWVPSFITPQLIVSVATIVVLVHVILILVAYLVQAERKFSAYIQDRLGPNRTGFDFGLPALKFLRGCLGFGQPLADGIKFMLKEDYTPTRVDKWLFSLAPIIVLAPALMGFIIIPWGGKWDGSVPFVGWLFDGTVHVAGAAMGVGIVYLLAIGALGVYGVTLGGYAGNNKFSFLGGLRATAQMISYEIPLGLSLMVALLVVGSVLPEQIIRHQVAHGWLVFSQPLAALLFFIAAMAEANRAPFDNAECEQELVGGYHTEYSSMRFALFFLAEYAHLVTSSAFLVLLFFGGYQALPFVNDGLTSPDAVSFWAVVTKIGVYFGKVIAVVTLIIVIRWTIPRLRYDQIMMNAWQLAIPLSLLIVVAVSVMIYFKLTGILPMLGANLAVLAVLLAMLPLLPKSNANHRIPMYGSRFSPMPGETVRTQSDEPMARADSPFAGARA
jgi:NADH-quinone oxidoreductase subunit H